jgi:hypothetical protein
MPGEKPGRGLSEEATKEVFRCGSQFIYWGFLAAVCCVFIGKRWVGPATTVSGPVSCFVEEHLNYWVLVVDLVIQIILAGVCALFLRGRFVSVVREEISRSFYMLGSFSMWGLIVLIYYYETFDAAKAGGWANNAALALILLGVPCAIGFALYRLSAPEHKISPADKVNQGH